MYKQWTKCSYEYNARYYHSGNIASSSTVIHVETTARRARCRSARSILIRWPLISNLPFIYMDKYLYWNVIFEIIVESTGKSPQKSPSWRSVGARNKYPSALITLHSQYLSHINCNKNFQPFLCTIFWCCLWSWENKHYLLFFSFFLCDG